MHSQPLLVLELLRLVPLIDARVRGHTAGIGQDSYTEPQKQSLSKAQY
jgi:hypothetical protein